MNSDILNEYKADHNFIKVSEHYNEYIKNLWIFVHRPINCKNYLFECQVCNLYIIKQVLNPDSINKSSDSWFFIRKQDGRFYVLNNLIYYPTCNENTIESIIK